MYYVYIHTLPNGKIYVGQTKQPVRRWNNGDGYVDNEELYNAIQKFGWNNIKHEIIGAFESLVDARIYEALLIFHLNSEDGQTGYNKTTMKKDLLEAYTKRSIVDGIDFEKPIATKNIFEMSGLPISACEEMINQWIFDKKNREILKDRLIDGMTFPDLANKYGISVRQLKNIVSDCSKMLETHLP